MEVTTEMYTKLFNTLTIISQELEWLNNRIKYIQKEVEEMYINQEV